MIILWYRHRGQRPRRTDIIREDATKASDLPLSFEVVGVSYGRQTQSGIDHSQFALRVETSSDTISQSVVDAIATAFEDNWGGTIEHVETVQV